MFLHVSVILSTWRVSRPRPKVEVGGSEWGGVSNATPGGWEVGGVWPGGVSGPIPGGVSGQGVSRPTPGGSRPTPRGGPGPHPGEVQARGVQGGCIPACTEADPPPHPAADSYYCGQYASYWNAFLFLLFWLIFANRVFYDNYMTNQLLLVTSRASMRMLAGMGCRIFEETWLFYDDYMANQLICLSVTSRASCVCNAKVATSYFLRYSKCNGWLQHNLRFTAIHFQDQEIW